MCAIKRSRGIADRAPIAHYIRNDSRTAKSTSYHFAHQSKATLNPSELIYE